MDLFVCQTAYQLFNAITIVKMNNIEADILFYDRRASKMCDMEKLREASFFYRIYEYYDFLDKVTDADANSFFKKIINAIKKMFFYPSALKYVAKAENSNNCYEHIYISYLDIPTEAVFYYHKKMHNSRLIVYDDGTYTCDCLKEKQNLFKTFLSKIAFGKTNIFNYCERVLVRQPNLVDKGRYVEMPVEQIQYNFSKLEQSNLVSVFKGNGDDVNCINKKIIFFDQPYKNKEIIKKQCDIVYKLSERYGKDNVIVKIHPSYKETEYDNQVNLFKSKVPFEVLINMFDIEKTILISIFSTACFTPKSISNKEPCVAFVYKTISLKKDGRDFDERMAIRYIKALQTNYIDKDKVFIPNNIDELFSFVDIHLQK